MLAVGDVEVIVGHREQEMYRVGVADALQKKIAGTQAGADATRRIFGNDLSRQKIAAGFGGADTDAFQNFQNTVNQQATFAQTQRAVLGGSPTARRMAGMADEAAGPDLLRPALHGDGSRGDLCGGPPGPDGHG